MNYTQNKPVVLTSTFGSGCCRLLKPAHKYLIIVLSFTCIYACSDPGNPECHLSGERKYTFSEEFLEGQGLNTEKPQIIEEPKPKVFQGEFRAIPQICAIVIPPVPGFIRKINVNNGDRVQKGQILAVLNHVDYLELKVQFLEAKNNLDFYKKNFARQGELAIEQATSLKKMEQAGMKYRQAELRYTGLKEKLRIIGINADNLTLGSLNDLSYLYAPGPGIIQEVHVIPGQYCSNQVAAFKISGGNQSHFQFNLDKETGIQVQPGDSIWVSTSGSASEFYTVHSVEMTAEGYKVLVPANGLGRPDEVHNISGEFIGIKKYYKLPAKALIHNKYILSLHEREDVIVKKVSIINREGGYITVEFFPLDNRTKFIIGNYENLLREICN